MNAITCTQALASRASIERQWIVLRCASSKTIALARLLSAFDSQDSARYPNLGAWTPVWKRRHRKPNSDKFELRELPALPSFVFLPAEYLYELPVIAAISYSPMRFDGALVRIADHQLNSLRKIDTQPKDIAKALPKIGAILRFASGPFQGLTAKVVYCTARYATVKVEGFAQPLQVPPSILQENC